MSDQENESTLNIDLDAYDAKKQSAISQSVLNAMDAKDFKGSSDSSPEENSPTTIHSIKCIDEPADENTMKKAASSSEKTTANQSSNSTDNLNAQHSQISYDIEKDKPPKLSLLKVDSGTHSTINALDNHNDEHSLLNSANSYPSSRGNSLPSTPDLTDVKDFEMLIHIVQEETDPDSVMEALSKIKAVTFDDEFIDCAEEQQLWNSLVSIIEAQTQHLDLQGISLEVLVAICQRSETICKEVQTSANYQAFLRMMTENLDNENLQDVGTSILIILLESEDVRNQILIDDQMNSLETIVFSWFKNFQTSPEIQRRAFQILQYILMEDAELHTEFLTKHLTIIRQCLFLHGSSPEVVSSIICILVVLADNEDNISTLLDYKIDQIAMETMTAMHKHEMVVEKCCQLLDMLTDSDHVGTKESVPLDMLYGTLLPVLQRFPTNREIQKFGLKTFSQQVSIIGGRILAHQSGSEDEICYQWCSIIYNAMVKQMDCPDIQKLACEAIISISKCYNYVGSFVGDGEVGYTKQLPLHSLCLGCLMQYGKDAHVFESVCEAIYWISADHASISQVLMKKNAHLLILDGIRRHMKNVTVLEAAFRAIRGLCIFHTAHKREMVISGVQSYLNKALRMYPRDKDLMLEVISCIACLADIDFVCHQCFIDKTHMKVIKIMSDFLEDIMIQEAGLECLGVLSSVESGSEFINATDAISHICVALERYADVPNIQKKGMMLLQLLVNGTFRDSKDIYLRLTRVIVSAMNKFMHDSSILKEACVTVQIMNQVSESFRELFVQGRCHEILFRILAEQYDTDLHDLAAECLIVFGLDDTITNKMLLAECAKGNVLGVQCLLDMDPDVNFGEGDHTPLCQAVMVQHEEIVKLLLKKNVLDISQALKLALGLDNQVITGHLLATLVNKREGYDIPWNSLGLGRAGLRREWFLTLKSTSSVSSDSPDNSFFGSQESLGNKIMSKVKKVEEKRLEREKCKMHTSKSEPVLKTAQARRLRFNLSQSKMHESRDRKGSFGDEAEIITFVRPDLDKKRPFNPGELSPISSPGNSIYFSYHVEDSSEGLMFEASASDVQEWKEESLTGANISYSTYDPRVRKSTPNKLIPGSMGLWRRKDRSPSPSTSNLLALMESSLTSDESKYPTSGLSSDGESSDFGRTRSRHASSDSVFSDNESRRNSVPAGPQAPKTLDLSDNYLSDLQGMVEGQNAAPVFFIFLEVLRLEHNCLERLPESFSSMVPRIQHLDMKNNKLKAFPKEIFACGNLQILELDDNEIDSITSGIVSNSLQELGMSHNRLSVIPDCIGCTFPNLKVLNLNRNNISCVPQSTPLGMLNLERLHLSHNEIKVIPDIFLSECPKLEQLELANNNLEKLPHESFAENLPKLHKLKLRMNNLATKEPLYIPKFVLDLPSIRSVDLSENNLVSLPLPAAWKSTMLKELIACKNSITKISLDGGKAFSKLELLNLAENGLLELPKEIGLLPSLTSLDISHNKLTTLPDELGKCSKLWELPLHGLPNLSLDPTLTKGRVKDLIIYLHNKLKKATEFYRMKLMLIGYGGRGKSTLLRALMKNFKNIERNQPTVGVIVKDWKFEIQHREKRGTVTCTLSTWDFAGQEEFYSSHQCYISGRAIYLVVCNIRRGTKEIDLLKPWLSTIHSRAPGCPVIFVMTHLDQVAEAHRDRMITEMNRKLEETMSKAGFPEIKGSYAVTCTKENISLQILRSAIRDVIDRYTFKGQPVMGQKIPASYVKLADILEAEVKRGTNPYPVITYSRLLKIVQDENLDLDKDELHQAVRFLHESGILLHYPDKALNLNNLYFIDPGWLCCMMAQVVTVKQINPFIRNGILRKADTSLLFTGKKVDKDSSFVFPKELIPQYLKLLEKFEIALPHSETELLIPCHLSDKRPNLDVPDLRDGEKVSRYYVMPYVPLGMWSRLITRMIVISRSSVTEVLIRQQNKPQLTYWNKGLVMVWDKNVFCLMESASQTQGYNEYVRITVPASKTGISILCLIIDHMDALIDEWYPGLTTLDPLQGKELLERLVPCTKCQDRGKAQHMFNLPELFQDADKSTHVTCPQCSSSIHIAHLAPDIMLSDLESELHLEEDEFIFEESAENLIGDGGFGNVYKAVYKKQVVAVKVFTAVADIEPNKMLRQEATILRCLHHPSVISLLAVSRQYKAIVLELAPLGSLAMVVRDGKVANKDIQHRIAIQTAEGMAYLHGLMIVYRDMKPDNVLIFSTSLTSVVNAKVSDYGIARFSTPDGLTAQEGTPAYRAPEVIRGETYSFKADVFSLGVTLYTMVTQGRHPFDNLEYKGEMDRAFAEGHAPPPITRKNVSPWPIMQHILTSCMQTVPDHRPTSEDVVRNLNNPDILGLKQVMPISVGTTVECLTIQEQDGGKVYLWIACGDCDNTQLSRVDLMDKTAEIKGVMFRYGRIMSLQTLSQGFLLVGTQLSKIWLYDSIKYELIHSTSILPDAVLCMKHIHAYSQGADDMIFAGLANGTVCVFSQSEILHLTKMNTDGSDFTSVQKPYVKTIYRNEVLIDEEPNTYPMCITTGQRHEAVRCLEYAQKRKRIYASCGSRIVIIDIRRSIAVDAEIETLKNGDLRPIYALLIGKHHVMVCHKGSAIVQVWNIGKSEIVLQWNISTMLQLDSVKCRVTAMCLQKGHGYVWLGTGGGHIVILEESTGKVVTTTKKYYGAIRTLKSIKARGPRKFSAILSGGLGFVEGNDDTKPDIETECGCVLVWDSEFGDKAKLFCEDIARRYRFTQNIQNHSWVTDENVLGFGDFDHENDGSTVNEMFDSL